MQLPVFSQRLEACLVQLNQFYVSRSRSCVQAGSPPIVYASAKAITRVSDVFIMTPNFILTNKEVNIARINTLAGYLVTLVSPFIEITKKFIQFFKVSTLGVNHQPLVGISRGREILLPVYVRVT